MADIEPFSIVILLVAAALIAAIGSSRLSRIIRVPAPALFLVGAALAAWVFPVLGDVPLKVNERIVTVALVFILFDGGMHIGWKRFRSAAGAVTWIGIAGTAVTAAAVAITAHFLFGFDWHAALLVGAALSPTDPAVVFSVLGKREVTGRAGTMLEGESGANDPVGIALMVSLLAAAGGGSEAILTGAGTFALEMAVGAAVGIASGFGLALLTRRITAPNEGLASLRTLACAAFIYGIATTLSGSGFLAVFLAGIIVGDVRGPYKQEIERFSSGIASLAEIVAFALLGLSVSLDDLLRPDVIWAGLVLAAVLIFVIRPVFVGVILAPIRLRLGERAFVLWSGLKGAVPILLGMFVLSAGLDRSHRIYAIIFIVVLVSVVLQGGLVPLLASVFRVPMRVVESRPWALGMRFQNEPQGLHRHVVAAGSVADGRTIDQLALGDTGWISMIRRNGHLVQVRGSTRLQAGDVILALAEPEEELESLFGEMDDEST